MEKIGKDESIIPISVVTGNSDDCVGQYYWVNNDKIKFKSNTENSSYVITSENIEVGMAVPKNSEATVDISKKNTPVSLKLSGDRKFEIEYTTTDNKENIILYKIQGIGGEEVSCEKNGSEIDITGVKNIETTISIGDKEISKNNISDLSEGDTYILNVNDNTFRRTEKIENNNVNAKVKVGKIKLLGVSKKISEGKKIVLKAVISPNNASNKTIAWKSSNPKVATVTQSGIVTMKKKTGGKKVTITAIATDGSNKYASWKITSMKGVVKKVKINGKKRIKAGKTLKLKAKVLATKHANKKLLWKSNNSKFATVNQKGVVKVHKKAKGKTIKITAFATDGSNKKSTIKIKVK